MSFGHAAMRGFKAFQARFTLRNSAAFACVVAASCTLVKGTQDANANGETRSLTMHHAHTNELITITFKRNGSFESGALEKLNWFLRDWRVDEPTSMAPQLFDVIWYVYREVGASEPIKIMSAYRSPGTNAMLRRRSRAVAKESQHMRGNAMDIHIPGVSMGKVRELGMRLQRGGVGYYPSAGSPFVHLDVGSVRSWPRMPREQLERMFPDGKTVHLPADGIPLANYEAALAEVQARGGSALDYDTVTTNRGKSLWALLFGGDEDEDANQPAARGRNTRVAAARGRGASPPEQVAAVSGGDSVSAWGVAAVAPQPIVRSARPIPSTIAPPSVPEPASQPELAGTAAPAVAPGLTPRPAAAEKQEPQLQIASLPVPPIRPRGAQLDRLIAASEPLPPIRPSSLLAFAATPPISSPAAAEIAASAPPASAPPVASAPPASTPSVVAAPLVAVAGIPLPPLRPAVQIAAVAPPVSAPVPVAEPAPPVAAAPVIPLPAASMPAVNLPLPPLRPAVAVAAVAPERVTLPGIVSRVELVPPAAPLTQAYAAIAAPLPPSRPVASAATRSTVLTVAVAPNPVAAVIPVAGPEPTPSRVLSRATGASANLAPRPAAENRPEQMIAVAEPPVSREIRSGVVAMSFTQPPASGGSGSGGFGGSFIRPLGASFTRAGE